MTKCTGLLILACVPFACRPSNVETEQGWDGLIARLRASDCVQGHAIGLAAIPSPQHALYKAVIARGNKARFQEMIADEHTVVRCIGLLALAKTEGKAAAPTLRRHLADRDEVGYHELCIVDSMTVADFSLQLLHNADWLVQGKGRTLFRLLSEAQWVELYFDILIADDMLAVHKRAADPLRILLRRKRVPLELPALRRQVPSLADWQIVKAVGRMKLYDGPRDFLIGCLRDKDLDLNARLAAASALTRRTDVPASQALRITRHGLNGLHETQWGDYFVATLNARRVHERQMKAVRAVSLRRDPRRAREVYVPAFTCDHALALDDLQEVSDGAVGFGHHDVDLALAKSFVTISENLDDFSQPWSTYADAAYKLDSLLRLHRRMEEYLLRERGMSPLLTAQQVATIKHNIERYTEEPR